MATFFDLICLPILVAMAFAILGGLLLVLPRRVITLLMEGFGFTVSFAS